MNDATCCGRTKPFKIYIELSEKAVFPFIIWSFRTKQYK